MAKWKLQDAKTRLSELIEAARRDGPQVITRYGRECGAVLSVKDDRSMLGVLTGLKASLFGGPKVDHWVVERERDTGRAVEL